MKNEVTQYHHTRYPEGMTLRNISDEQIRSEFASGVTEYFGHFIREGNTKMPNNNPWNEYSELRDVASMMNEIVRQAAKTRDILRSQMNENYVDQIEENTAVNVHVKKRADAIRGIPHTEERKQAIKEGRAKGKKSSGNKGKRYSNPNISLAKKGIPRKEEHIKSAAAARIGQIWWNNGIIQTRSLICPGDDFVAGRLPGRQARDLKIYILTNPEFGDIKTTRSDFINTYQLSVGKVSQLLNKKCAQYKGWTLLDIISS